MLSQAVEDYLKAIYLLEEEEEPVSTTELAEALDVSSASATNMIKRLAEGGFVSHEPYKGVKLTDPGRTVALEIVRHHRLIELYLREVMGYSLSEVHAEAEHLEHHISEDFEDRMEEMLGFPTHDPHGHPIPTRSGEMVDHAVKSLADAEVGDELIIRSVSDADPELLDYLEGCGLIPGARVTVTNKEPFEGPLTLKVDDEEMAVGLPVLLSIFVEPVTAGSDEVAAG